MYKENRTYTPQRRKQKEVVVLSAMEVGLLTAYALKESYMPLNNLSNCIKYPTKGLDRWKKYVKSDKAKELIDKGNLPFFLKPVAVPDFMQGLINGVDELCEKCLDADCDEVFYKIGRAIALQVSMDMSNFNDLVSKMGTIGMLTEFLKDESGISGDEARALVPDADSIPVSLNYKDLSKMYMGFAHQMVERRRAFLNFN